MGISFPLTYLPYSAWATYAPYGILTVLATGNVHAIFGVINVLAFGNIHDLGDVHAVFGVLACLLWCTHCTRASCKQQHEFLIVAWESV